MSIEVIKAGILDTIQDGGRNGFSKWGINRNGPMDSFAMRIANALVGNDLNEGVIEMHFPASEFVFTSRALIAIAGADFSATINDQPVPNWRTLSVPANAVLKFHQRRKGMRAYLAIHGGLGIARWLGSCSTNLKARVGGNDGRALKSKDRLAFRKSFQFLTDELAVMPWNIQADEIYSDTPIGILKGHEWSVLDSPSQRNIFSAPLQVSSSSDRMASFLVHEPFAFQNTDQLLSSAVTFGTVQALPSGQLCVLMADHQTTGGYPRVAHICSAHLPKFAQRTPGELFNFREMSLAEAEKLLLSLNRFVGTMTTSLRTNLNARYDMH